MNALQVQVSFFSRLSDTHRPTNGSFYQIVTSAKLAAQYAPLIERIRATEDKAERDQLKKQLPCFTPSGTFSRRAAAGLLAHSGLIQFDIDPKQNPALTASNAPSLRDKIGRFQHVAFCGLSASGEGVWGVVPIAYPDRHKEHFAALATDFAAWGIVIDPACSNVDRLRFWSHDPDAVIKNEATIYRRLPDERPPVYTSTSRPTFAATNADKMEDLIAQIEASGIDITAGGNGYEDWFALACALACEFGESGRDYFHRVSRFYPKYSSREADRQFTACLQSGKQGYTLGTFIEIARRYGVAYTRATERPFFSASKAPVLSFSTRPTFPPGFSTERFKSRISGESFDLVINPDGYPADWDLQSLQYT